MTFTVGQRVRVLSTLYQQKHLQPGATGTVQSLLGGLVIVEVDDDPSPGNWSFEPTELEQLEQPTPVGHDGDWDIEISGDDDAVWVHIALFEHTDTLDKERTTAFSLQLSDVEAEAFAQGILDAVEQRRLGDPDPADERSYWADR